jgi:hypothetical protein
VQDGKENDDMAGRTYRIRIARGELQFEAEGDKAFVLAMLKNFEGRTSGPGESPGKGKGKTPKSVTTGAEVLTSSKAVSVGEFIRQFGFKKHTDRVLAFGYYLEQHSGLQEFTPADINNLYYEAKMEPSNTSQAIILNIKRGFVMEAKRAPKKKGGAKTYTLTASGEAHLKKVAAKTADAE